MDRIKFKAVEKILSKNSKYKRMNRFILLAYCLFLALYLCRADLYALNNNMLDLVIGSAPNFIPSIIFSVLGVFYLVPLLTGTFNTINDLKYLVLINISNLVVFVLIEYIHVLFNLGSWDSLDIVASILGIVIASFYYFMVRNLFSGIQLMNE